MSKFARLSLIAAASVRFASPVSSPRHLCAVPSHVQGSRFSAASSGTLTPSERARLTREVAALRAGLSPVSVA